MSDIFVRDRRNGRTSLASVAATGATAIGTPESLVHAYSTTGARTEALSYDPSISASGRYIAYSSGAINLVEGDTNISIDIFVYDRKTGENDRVSVNSQGEQSGLSFSSRKFPDSYYPSISANGRFVSFTSFADNLVKDDTNGQSDVFVHDRETHKTERVSLTWEGKESRMSCGLLSPVLPGEPLPDLKSCIPGEWYPHSSISADGRYVTFDADSPDLVADDTNTMGDVYLFDRKSNSIERISVSSQEKQGVDDHLCAACAYNRGSSLTGWSASRSSGRTISADGRYVVFASSADNLVPSDHNHDATGITRPDGVDIFVRDRRSGRTDRVNVTPTGGEARTEQPGTKMAIGPAITSDGRFVTWETGEFFAPKMLDEARHGVYLHDRRTGATEYLSWMSAPERWARLDNHSTFVDISADGRFVSFASAYWPSGSKKQDQNAGSDIFVRDRGEDVVSDIQNAVEGAGLRVGNSMSSSAAYLRDVADDSATTSPYGDLLRASIVSRPALADLFVRIDAEELGPPLSTDVPGPLGALMVYGFDFSVDGTQYELRASQVPREAFQLFRCDSSCVHLADLHGGYGTVGESVVMSVPLDLLGLQGGGEIVQPRAFAAAGSIVSGPQLLLDEVGLKI